MSDGYACKQCGRCVHETLKGCCIYCINQELKALTERITELEAREKAVREVMWFAYKNCCYIYIVLHDNKEYEISFKKPDGWVMNDIEIKNGNVVIGSDNRLYGRGDCSFIGCFAALAEKVGTE